MTDKTQPGSDRPPIPPADASRPVVPKPRRFGFMEGMFEVPDDFDTMFQEEIERMFGIEDAKGSLVVPLAPDSPNREPPSSPPGDRTTS